MSTDALLGPLRHPTAGPRWRVAVVRRDTPRHRPLADEIVNQLRAAGCMAVEIDTTGHDPFVDIESQWSSAVAADAYDLVLSIDRLLPTAVVIAALAGVPVATVVTPPATPMPTAIETAIAAGRVRAMPVLDIVADDLRQVTANGIDITTRPDSGVAAQLSRSGHTRPIDSTGWSISPIAGPTGQFVVTTHHDDAVHQGHQLRLRAPHRALDIEIDTAPGTRPRSTCEASPRGCASSTSTRPDDARSDVVDPHRGRHPDGPSGEGRSAAR